MTQQSLREVKRSRDKMSRSEEYIKKIKNKF